MGYTNKFIIDEEGLYKPSGKKQTDHNTFLLNVSIPVQRVAQPPKKIWKINKDTDWQIYQDTLAQHQPINYTIESNPNHQHHLLTTTITNTAIQTIGQITTKPTKRDPVLQSCEVKIAKFRRNQAKKEYLKAIRDSDGDTIKRSLDLYVKEQLNTKEIINLKHTQVFESKLDMLAQCGGTNSKIFWNLVRQIRKPNTEDTLPIQTEDGVILYEESDILEYTAKYYEELYTMQTSSAFSTHWSQHIQANISKNFQNMQYEKEPTNRTITVAEIRDAIKKLQTHKAYDHQGICNELLIKGGEPLIRLLEPLFNTVFHSEIIPEAWQISQISNFGKANKKEKLKLSNKRGIAISSNIGKLFERVLLKRAASVIQFTEAQAGGRIQRGCVDHIFTLHAVIRQRMHVGKPTFVAFLDIEKAYDRVWKDAMFDSLWRNGLKGKIWRIMYYLNSDLKASVKTKFGHTRVFRVTEGIRQGGPLSGIEFGAMMDQEERHLRNKGLTFETHDLLIASLLLQDDIAILAETPRKLQQALEQIYNFACQFRLKFNTDKSKVIAFNYIIDEHCIWTLGGNPIELTTEHKWIGLIVNPMLSLSQHINDKEHQIQGILQSCLATINDEILGRMKMKSLLKLHLQCLTPSIIYGLHAWNITENEMAALEKIQYTILRRILKTPKSTPKLS